MYNEINWNNEFDKKKSLSRKYDTLLYILMEIQGRSARKGFEKRINSRFQVENFKNILGVVIRRSNVHQFRRSKTLRIQSLCQ